MLKEMMLQYIFHIYSIALIQMVVIIIALTLLLVFNQHYIVIQSLDVILDVLETLLVVK